MTAAAGTIEIFGQGSAGSPIRHGSARPPALDPGLPIRPGALDQPPGTGYINCRPPAGTSGAPSDHG